MHTAVQGVLRRVRGRAAATGMKRKLKSADVREYLLLYMDQLLQEGYPAGDAEKTVAVCKHLMPQLGRGELRQRLVRALKGP